jgi:hypothetical protein
MNVIEGDSGGKRRRRRRRMKEANGVWRSCASSISIGSDILVVAGDIWMHTDNSWRIYAENGYVNNHRGIKMKKERRNSERRRRKRRSEKLVLSRDISSVSRHITHRASDIMASLNLLARWLHSYKYHVAWPHRQTSSISSSRASLWYIIAQHISKRGVFKNHRCGRAHARMAINVPWRATIRSTGGIGGRHISDVYRA